MENTTKAGAFHFVRAKLLRGLVLIILTFLVSRAPLMGGCFPAAVAAIAYMMSKNTINLYLIIPAAAGVLPYIVRGYDPWGDLAAMAVCGLLFTVGRRIKLALWHRALIAASISIICTSIYRMATNTVYKTGVGELLLEGFLVFSMVILFDAFYSVLEKGSAPDKQLSLTALTAVCLLAACGAGLGFIIWPIIIFLNLAVLAYGEAGQGFLTVAVAGAFAALAGQAQWGFLITLLLGTGAAAFVKKCGVWFSTGVFLLTCWALRSVESGVVLGIDNYTLFLAAAAFLAVHWKFGSRLKKIVGLFAARTVDRREEMDSAADLLLRTRSGEMKDLAELYGTYLDSRCLLANQFQITEQILGSIRWQIGQRSRAVPRITHEKMDVDIAVSQCAAAGAINGDCCGWQDIGDGKVAMVVSDGMGKGKKAATESLLVVKTIMGLLKTGVTTDLTLKMINTIMLMKEDEDSFATVDLIILDKKTAKAKFYKIGAAPTLIRRKNNVEEVKLSAVPLGIVNGLRIRYVEASLKKDDWIIMMSDGVSDGGDGKGFLHQLKEAVRNVRSTDPRTMCDLLLNQAADSYIGRERDDLTVMVARII